MIYIMVKFPNEYQDIEKMSQNAPIGGLWGDFATIFWIIKYLQ
jgi:hypothetical protein